jgi:hypothetical protein
MAFGQSMWPQILPVATGLPTGTGCMLYVNVIEQFESVNEPFVALVKPP